VNNPILDGINQVICPGGSNTVTYMGVDGDWMKCGATGFFSANNWVLHDFTQNLNYPVTSNRDEFNIMQGQGCWMSGAGAKEAYRQSYYSTVRDPQTYFNVNWRGITYAIEGFKCMHEATFGDSGGPVYYDNTAMGIMSAISPGSGYTRVTYLNPSSLDARLNIKLCLNSDCTN
jgi:hypothetical protein